MAKKFYIAAAKGGAGATTTAIGLGYALSDAGERTLVFDGDHESGCALSVCGCLGMQTFTLADYKNGYCRAKQTLVAHPKHKNLYIMPSLGCDDPSAAREAVLEAEGLFDFVLCDGGPPDACGQAIVVTEPYPPALTAAGALAGRLRDAGIKICGTMVNKVNGGLLLGGKIGRPEEIASALSAPLIAALPEDLALTLGEWRPFCMKCFKVAAARLCGKKARQPRLEEGYTGAGGYFRRRMRSRI